MITIKNGDFCGILDNLNWTVYELEYDTSEHFATEDGGIREEYRNTSYVVIEDGHEGDVGIIHKDDLIRDDDERFFVVPEWSDVYWITGLNYKTGGYADYFNDQCEEFNSNVDDCVSAQTDTIHDDMKTSLFKTEEEYFYGRDLACFLVDRYLRPLIEYGFLNDGKKGYAQLDTNVRGMRLHNDYTATEAYDEETECNHEIMPCSEYEPQVPGFHDWCYLSICNRKFWLTICGQDVELCSLDTNPEDMRENMPAFLMENDMDRLLIQMEQMQDEFYGEEEK